ncbi:hypothetical protein Psta_2069 [Pirellula staleyi DSM 6068]|uniref:Uncharacterized protein n=1 Tax=Pirellula staleyi (strain ATCC 27377 / DSM 6068 / ICPB 4128) TaxID=530564 RepID=D2R1M4_PIRSD|nr:hypothetical protein Psta_2069 [Pirellula staleyi DSM 6068]
MHEEPIHSAHPYNENLGRFPQVSNELLEQFSRSSKIFSIYFRSVG